MTAKKRNDSDALERGRFKLQRGLVELTYSHVFAASIIMRLQRDERVGLPAPLATDGIRLFYDPVQIADWPVAHVKAGLAHEAFHVAGRHPLRREHRQVDGWRLACEPPVNHLCQEAELELPDWTVPPENDTPEHIYQQINDEARKLTGKGLCELMEPTHDDGRPLTKGERDALDVETREWVTAAASAAKRAGQLHAGLEQFVGRSLRSVQDWREVLARFICERRPTDYSWLRPNKRYVQYDVYLPSLDARDVPRVAIAPDTSGSTMPIIERVVAEAIGALETMTDGADLEVPILWFDADVYPQLVTSTEELKPKGGGGTDYAPVMAWISEHAATDDFRGLVVITDGECASFGELPPCDVLWVLTQDIDFKPPFGELALVLSDA